MINIKQLRYLTVAAVAVHLLPLLAFAQAKAPAADIAANADKYLSARLEIKQTGGSALIARGGQVIFSKGYGLADEEAKVQNTPATKFRIGSITKQFTAAAILMLQENGKLSVKDPICKFMDKCPDVWQGVTLHHLLSMSSGIESFTSLPNWGPELRTKDLDPAATVTLVAKMPLKFTPGEKFDYSNTNYVLLGMVIEKVSGKSYEKFLQKKIFGPLKLKATGYDHGITRLPGSALGYTLKENKIVPADKASMRPPYAAGGLYSTTEDLYKWQTALFEGNVFKRPETLTAMLTPVAGTYAYGLNVSTDAKGRRSISHGGAIEGFNTNAVYFPADRLFVAIFVNNDRGAVADPMRNLTAIADGEPFTMPEKRVEIKLDRSLLEKFVGVYSVGEAMSFDITLGEEGLMMEPKGQRKVQIFPQSETKFFLTVVDATLQFQADEDGNITGLEYSQAGRKTQFKRIK